MEEPRFSNSTPRYDNFSWDIKFDGFKNPSVENFIYRIELLVTDTLEEEMLIRSVTIPDVSSRER